MPQRASLRTWVGQFIGVKRTRRTEDGNGDWSFLCALSPARRALSANNSELGSQRRSSRSPQLATRVRRQRCHHSRPVQGLYQCLRQRGYLDLTEPSGSGGNHFVHPHGAIIGLRGNQYVTQCLVGWLTCTAKPSAGSRALGHADQRRCCGVVSLHPTIEAGKLRFRQSRGREPNTPRGGADI